VQFRLPNRILDPVFLFPYLRLPSMPACADPVDQLIAALASISLPPPDLQSLGDTLRQDPGRLSLVDLGLDSLGRLETCIALEIEQGVLITPETVAALHGADQLLRRIATAPRV